MFIPQVLVDSRLEVVWAGGCFFTLSTTLKMKYWQSSDPGKLMYTSIINTHKTFTLSDI